MFSKFHLSEAIQDFSKSIPKFGSNSHLKSAYSTFGNKNENTPRTGQQGLFPSTRGVLLVDHHAGNKLHLQTNEITL